MRRVLAVLAMGLLAVPAAALAAESKVAFQFQDERITESSGLAASHRHDGIVYTHNDSDAGPLVFAIDGAGETVATLTLRGAPARDWEAISSCRDGGRDVLWVGDIGDNIDAWKTYRLLRVPEPASLQTANVEWTQYDMKYADGKARDAEALMCHPRTGRLYVVSKENDGEAGIYRGPATMKRGAVNTFTRVADAPGAVTDATFLDDGAVAVLRGYFEVGAYAPVANWKRVARFTPPIQIQGESVAITAPGDALLFGSEGVGSSVWRVPIPEDLQELPFKEGVGVDAGEAKEKAKDTSKNAKKKADKAAKDVTDNAQRVNDEGIPGIDGQMIALLSALGLGVMVLFMVTRRG